MRPKLAEFDTNFLLPATSSVCISAANHRTDFKFSTLQRPGPPLQNPTNFIQISRAVGPEDGSKVGGITDLGARVGWKLTKSQFRSNKMINQKYFPVRGLENRWLPSIIKSPCVCVSVNGSLMNFACCSSDATTSKATANRNNGRQLPPLPRLHSIFNQRPN